MTKQVETFLDKSNGVEKTTTSNVTATKKEESSFFDSILAQANTKNKSLNNDSNTDTKEKNNTGSLNNAVIEKETKKSKIEVTNEVKNSKTDISDKTPSSFLDRMLMEAKNSIKEQGTKETISNELNTAKNKKTNHTKAEQEEKNLKDKNTLNKEKPTNLEGISNNKLEKTVDEVKTDSKTDIKADTKIEVALEKNSETKNDKTAINKTIETQDDSVTDDSVKNKKTDTKSDAKTDLKTDIKIEEILEKNTDTSNNKTTQNKTADIKEPTVSVESNVTNKRTNTQLHTTLDLKNPIKLDSKPTEVAEKSIQTNVIKTSNVEEVTTKVVQNASLTNSAMVEEKEQTETKITQKENSKISQGNEKIIDTQKSPTNVQEAKTLNSAPTQLNGTDLNETKTQIKQTVNPLNANDKVELFDEKNTSLKEEKTNNSANALKEVNKNEENIKDSTLTAETKNKKVADSLAKLNNQVTNESVNISKKELNNSVPDNKSEKSSLMDQLLNETKEKLATPAQNSSTKVESNTQIKQQPQADILTNIYMSSRNNSIEKNSLETLHKGKEQALNAKSVQDVKTSAKTLDLGLNQAKVEVNNQENVNADTNTLDTFDRLALSKSAIQEEIENSEIKSKSISKEASKVALGEISLNVSAQNTQIITQRIIGARQQMSSMMSDIAKEMYTNYKPPITAFRLNLQPAHLGTIAILIKSDKENAISISMNMSNSATLDAITDNQGNLRTALTKTFGDENNFDLSFGNQSENSEQSSEQNHERNEQQHHAQTSTAAILEAREENKEEMLINYM